MKKYDEEFIKGAVREAIEEETKSVLGTILFFLPLLPLINIL